jgi:hypothetical protein
LKIARFRLLEKILDGKKFFPETRPRRSRSPGFRGPGRFPPSLEGAAAGFGTPKTKTASILHAKQRNQTPLSASSAIPPRRCGGFRAIRLNGLFSLANKYCQVEMMVGLWNELE